MTADAQSGWSDLLHPSGIRRFAGKDGIWYSPAGGGIIECATAPRIGIDANLYGCLKVAVDALKLHVVISSVDTGVHKANSRHRLGLAVDIDRIGPVGVLPVALVTPSDRDAYALVKWLLERGFKAGEGRGNPGPGVLWGPIHSDYNPSDANHGDHVHISLGRK